MASKTPSKTQNRTPNKTQPQKKRNAYAVGIVVAIALAVLTLVEYYVALLPNQSVIGLFLLAFIKAALVVYFFMHVYRLWRPDAHADDHAADHATGGGH